MIRKLLCVLAVFAGAVAARGQAVTAAYRELNIEVGGFAGYSFPDYTQNKSIAFGGVADVNTRSFFGLEAEGTYTDILNSNGGSEFTVGVGPRFYHVWNQRYIPYVKIMVGLGHFSFPSDPAEPESGSTNFAYLSGGGLDYRLKRHITLRGDAEYQIWPGFGNANDPRRRAGSLTPFIVTGGVKYRF